MRRRKINDGLPHRVYERRGLKIYSIGYKSKKNKWVFRLQCDVNDAGRIKQLRREATIKATALTSHRDEIVTIAQLSQAFFEHHEALLAQPKARGARKKSTLNENKREAATLCTAFGEMAITDVKFHHAAMYQDECDQLGRGPKADKEITLLSKLLAFARRRGIIHDNPLAEIERLPSRASDRYVTHDELNLAVEVGERKGGAQYVAALGLAAAYYCVRRSVEVRALRKTDLAEEGIWWTEGKTPYGVTPKRVLMEWSPALRDVIDKALAARPATALGPYVFGTQEGEQYARHSWKPGLNRLMNACVEEAQRRGIPFKKFSLMDLRPKGVSDKLEAGEKLQDVVDAAMHNSTRMVISTYDRLKKRKSTPTADLGDEYDKEGE